MSKTAAITLTVFSTITLAGSLSISATAADRNTYRPGQAYAKTAAVSHMACEYQCRGDAQCRGWNFVRPNPKTASGICEFNSRAAMPVNSPISISGEIRTSIDPLMSRAVPTGSRTTRVGTPTVFVPKPARSLQGQTQIKRVPVPQRSPALQQATTRTPAPQTRTQMTPQQMQYRQLFLAEQQKQAQLQAQQAQQQAQQQAMLRQQQFQQRQAVPPQFNRPMQMAPVAPMTNAPQGPPMAQRAPQGPQMQPMPAAPQPLYGSLHDDLTKNMTPVPRPETAPDNLDNPDAPVSTSRAAPTKPVEAAPLEVKMVPGLAGG